MDIRYKKDANKLSLYLYGELDEYSSNKAKEILDKVIYDNLNTKKVVFDLSGLSFMDSTGIGLLIGRYKRLKQYNINSYISGATLSVEKVLEISGIYQIMEKI